MTKITTLLQTIGAKVQNLLNQVNSLAGWVKYIVEEVWGTPFESTAPTKTSRIDTLTTSVTAVTADFRNDKIYPLEVAPTRSHWDGAIEIERKEGSAGLLACLPATVTNLDAFVLYFMKHRGALTTENDYADPGATPMATPYAHWTNAIRRPDLVSLEDWMLGVDAMEEGVTSHLASYSAHGATNTATASRIILRDANGRAKVSTPDGTSPGDIVNLDFLRPRYVAYINAENGPRQDSELSTNWREINGAEIKVLEWPDAPSKYSFVWVFYYLEAKVTAQANNVKALLTFQVRYRGDPVGALVNMQTPILANGQAYIIPITLFATINNPTSGSIEAYAKSDSVTNLDIHVYYLGRVVQGVMKNT